MLTSLKWLRTLCPVTAQAEEIAATLTARGLTVDAVVARGDDHQLDIDVPANRPDCLGHRGLARELGAAFAQTAAATPERPPTRGAGVASVVQVSIEAPDLCARYSAGLVRGVRVGPSPEWVVQRLDACGLRSLNNVVDASNLVMLETGNPIHFFDLERVAQRSIVVRRANPGETLTSLDGIERNLDPAMLAIADTERAVALAGVIGGADTEIGLSTRDVLVEAAWFLPRSVRSTSRRLSLKTDASHRFERGVDPEGVLPAQELAARLLAELAGGAPAPGLLDEYPGRFEPRKLVLRLARLPRLLGYDPGEKATLDALAALQLAPDRLDRESCRVTVPSWRVDLEREVDLVEEVARHLGYERIPAATSGMPNVAARAGADGLERRAADLLLARGFHEAFSYAMISEGEDARFVDTARAESLALTNPIADWMTRLRRSVLPGLLRAVDLNLRRGVRDVRLFETGHVFLRGPTGGFPEESARIAVVWTGAGRPRHWSEKDHEVDLLDVAGLVEYLLDCLRPGLPRKRRRADLGALHPGQAVCWEAADGLSAAWAGALHPELGAEFPQPVFVAEIDLAVIERTPLRVPQYAVLPRLTAVSRDLSLIVESATSYEAILEVLAGVRAPAQAAFEVVDRYEGPPLAPGQASLTVRAVLRPDERTLTDPEIESYRLALIEALDRTLGIRIRG